MPANNAPKRTYIKPQAIHPAPEPQGKNYQAIEGFNGRTTTGPS